jgi:hypothetical protein
MTITLFIENDKDRSVVESYDCDFCEGKGCSHYHCENGKVIFRSSKWEVNMANGNFVTLMSALGINPGNENGCGAIDGRTLLDAINRFRPELAVRSTTEEHTEGGALFINCGIDSDYVTRRITKLREIATEAARREEMIVWG